MDLHGLADDFRHDMLEACNIGYTGPSRGFQVSIRRPGGDGWEVYYGPDLADAIERAVAGGPQLPGSTDEDDWGGLV